MFATPGFLDGLAQEDSRGFRIAAGYEPEVDHLRVSVGRAPQVTPLPATPDTGFINMPVEADPAPMLARTLGQFMPELLGPLIDRQPSDNDSALGEETSGVLIGNWITKIYTNGTKDNDGRESVVLEPLAR